MAVITGPFADVLRVNRSDFNARFAQARRRFPEIDKEVFGDFLGNCAAPVVAAVAGLQPERVAGVVYAAFDAGLELVGQRLVGRGAENSAIAAGWRDLLPVAARQVGQMPGPLLAGFSNALYHLARTPGARPGFWVTEMLRLTPLCADAALLLQVGQMLAWRAGLAHLREGVLQRAAALAPDLALAAVGADPLSDWPATLLRLQQDPWFDPGAALPHIPSAAATARVGGFRGFGGLFVAPPEVAADSQHLWVRSAEECWLLTADCFGHTFHRATTEEFDAAARNQALPGEVKVRGTQIVHPQGTLDLADLVSIRSVAATAHTLALTSPCAHAIVLIPLRRP